MVLEKPPEVTFEMFNVKGEDPCVALKFDLKFPLFFLKRYIFFPLIKVSAMFSEIQGI